MQPPVRLSAAYVGHLLQGDRKAAVALARRCVTISASMPSHIRYVSAMVRAVRADPRTRTVKVVVVINDDGVSDQSLHEEITTITNDYGALHRRIVRDLAKARAELAKAHTVLGTGAHDLRTPLTVVLGFAEILLSDEELTPPCDSSPSTCRWPSSTSSPGTISYGPHAGCGSSSTPPCTCVSPTTAEPPRFACATTARVCLPNSCGTSLPRSTGLPAPPWSPAWDWA